MKKITILFSILLLFSCAKKEQDIEDDNLQDRTTVIKDSISENEIITAIDSSNLIVEGMQIGSLKIGQNSEALSTLGKPDVSNSAMGRSSMLWYNRNDSTNLKTELVISTGYRDNTMKEKIVKEIRITSLEYKTHDGHGVGSTLLEIVEEYPDVRSTIEFVDTKTKKKYMIFDDSVSGIAFEITDDKWKKCTAVIVHQIEQVADNDYLLLNPNYKINNAK